MYTKRTRGYSADGVQLNKGFLDYVFPDIESYNKDAIQYNIGMLDYVTGPSSYYSDVIINQSSGWSVNWELINMQWETINVNWEI
jgi:hypothetical protein